MCVHCQCNIEHECLMCRDEKDENYEYWDEPIFENAFCNKTNANSCSCIYENEDDWDSSALL